MNTRKIIGYVIALAAATIPLQRALLNVEATASPSREGSGNAVGVGLFVLFMVGIFVSYWLIDSANASKKKDSASGH